MRPRSELSRRAWRNVRRSGSGDVPGPANDDRRHQRPDPVHLIASIAAVIIGGACLNGGVGSMTPTVVAVFIPVVLNNGLIIMGIERFWQDIAIGAILVAAVGFDQWRREQARNRHNP
jgi:lysylphosphatidylglycerol synthetase-like protein (DUF2156 family)